MAIPIQNKEPNTGRLQKDDDSLVNIADLATGKTVTFHDNVTTTGDGDSKAINGFKVLTLSCKGTCTSITVEIHGVDSNGIDNTLPLFSVVNFAKYTSLTIRDLSFACSVEGMVSVYAKITAIAGGNATIIGRLT